MIVNEIFESIDGEVNRFGQGHITTFIRLGGCNLRCSYCDTPYAQLAEAGEEMTLDQIIGQVRTAKITITGGEPLAQLQDVIELIIAFKRARRGRDDRGYKVTVETNGSIAIPYDTLAYMNRHIGWVVDWKFEYDRLMVMENFYRSGERDWIKFVLDKPSDYNEMVKVIDHIITGGARGRVAVGLTDNMIGMVGEVREWLVGDRLDDHVLFNFQLHKMMGVK